MTSYASTWYETIVTNGVMISIKPNTHVAPCVHSDVYLFYLDCTVHYKFAGAYG